LEGTSDIYIILAPHLLLTLTRDTLFHAQSIPFVDFLHHVEVTPITGGLTNLLHCVAINTTATVNPCTSLQALRSDAKGSLTCAVEDMALSELPETTKVVVRIYGTDSFANRTVELDIARLASEWGISETLFHAWPRGRISSFLEGASLSPAQWADTEVSSNAALLMGMFHALPLPPSTQGSEVAVTATMARWYALAADTKLFKDTQAFAAAHPDAVSMFSAPSGPGFFPIPSSLAPFLERLTLPDSHPNAFTAEPPAGPVPSREEQLRLLAFLDVPALGREVGWLVDALQAAQLTTSLCHNDIHGGNVILREGEPSECSATNGKHLPPSAYKLIDFEYGGFSYSGFDLGNSICETTIMYTGPYPGFVIDCPGAVDRILHPRPTKEDATVHDYEFTPFETNFAEHYQRGHGLVASQLSGEVPPCEKSVSKILVEASILSLASHLQWAIWSVIMADEGTIPFGYLEYACIRMMIYLKKKAALQKIGVIKK
jgi:thiamine kinase-like enzyme